MPYCMEWMENKGSKEWVIRHLCSHIGPGKDINDASMKLPTGDLAPVAVQAVLSEYIV